MKIRAIGFVSALVTMIILDTLWIGVIMSKFYSGSALGDHARIVDGTFSPNLAYMPFGYLLYALGFVVFVQPMIRDTSIDQTARIGAFFGLFTVGTYHLWNLMMLQDWSITLAITDGFYAIMSGGIIAIVMNLAIAKLASRSHWFSRG